MRLLAALPLLALAACSSDPVPPVDSGPHVDQQPDAGWPWADAGEDRPGVDTGPGDVVAVADVPAMDAVDATSGDVGTDAVAVGDAGSDAGALDALDAQPGDAGVDAVAVGDAGPPDAGSDAAAMPEAPPVDAGPEAGADVPRDTGPVDGGPVVYDLEAARAALEVRALVRETLTGGASEDCEAPPTATSCSVTGDTLRFSLHTCSTDLTGLLPLSSTTGRVVSIFAGGGGSSATTIRIEAGRRVAGSPARQSFHVQLAAPAFQGEPAVSGIPGRTVDPALADLWLLGCPSD